MKKILCFYLIFALMFAFCSCSPQPPLAPYTLEIQKMIDLFQAQDTFQAVMEKLPGAVDAQIAPEKGQYAYSKDWRFYELEGAVVAYTFPLEPSHSGENTLASILFIAPNATLQGFFGAVDQYNAFLAARQPAHETFVFKPEDRQETELYGEPDSLYGPMYELYLQNAAGDPVLINAFYYGKTAFSKNYESFPLYSDGFLEFLPETELEGVAVFSFSFSFDI